MFVVLRRRHARRALATLSVFSVAIAGLVASPGPAAASVGSDKADLARLEQEIAAQGVHEQALVSRYNEVQAQVDALDAQIAHDQSRLDADQRVEATAMSALRRLAVKAYVSGGGMDSPALAMFSGTASVNAMLEQNVYVGAVNNKLDDALTTMQLDQARTKDAQSALRSEQAQAVTTLRTLKTARDAATATIAADEAKLSHVRGDLRSLLAAASAQHHAAELAAERRLATARLSAPSELPPASLPSSPARQPASSETPSVPSPVPVTSPVTDPVPVPGPAPPPSGGGYANPLRSVVALTAERIDQGVDYSGFGSIYAIGDGVVLNTVGSGWPGGTFIAYRLTDGPARGLVVYVAEDVQASVQVGDTVTSGTVLGHMYAGPDGIETGWADGSSLPDTMARTYGQFDGSNSSAFGDNFSRLLQSLGAPPGIPSGSVSGSLPATWPRW
jgi:murein DD-endopeptidase MepM/ murein hydrolase activator NlpD